MIACVPGAGRQVRADSFGPSGSEKTRHNPFWHLRTDGVWQLAGPAEITSRPAGATPTITELRRGRVAGGFAEPVRLALARDPARVAEIARRILNAHFPESIRQSAMHSRASSLPQLLRLRARPAHGRARLGGHVAGLEAAHIK
jgi:putative restriction endonuclease